MRVTLHFLVLTASLWNIIGGTAASAFPASYNNKRATLISSRFDSSGSSSRSNTVLSSWIVLTTLRGGDGEQQTATISDEGSSTPPTNMQRSRNNNKKRAAFSTMTVVPITSAFASFGKFYATSLENRPILTKSITAGFIFALSDFLAQKLEKQEDARPKKLDATRMLASAAVGLFYFGPAAHYWYKMIFQILPGTSLVSTLQKAALGQIFFGPTFTCIFFATGLMQTGNFSIANWFRKIKSDLPSAWLAGAGFWPLVDLVSYSLISPEWIPLFVNLCSFVWTTYLVIKSYK